jgi:predicted nucleic-acid-binding protein
MLMSEMLLPNQTILDANSFIRIATQDNLTQAQTALDFLKNNDCFVPIEVTAEVINVLTGNYYHWQHERAVIIFLQFMAFPNIIFEKRKLLDYTLDLFRQRQKLDFVDCMLASYHYLYGNKVFTFDKKLDTQIKRQDEERNNA